MKKLLLIAILAVSSGYGQGSLGDNPHWNSAESILSYNPIDYDENAHGDNSSTEEYLVVGDMRTQLNTNYMFTGLYEGLYTHHFGGTAWNTNSFFMSRDEIRDAGEAVWYSGEMDENGHSVGYSLGCYIINRHAYYPEDYWSLNNPVTSIIYQTSSGVVYSKRRRVGDIAYDEIAVFSRDDNSIHRFESHNPNDGVARVSASRGRIYNRIENYRECTCDDIGAVRGVLVTEPFYGASTFYPEGSDIVLNALNPGGRYQFSFKAGIGGFSHVQHVNGVEMNANQIGSLTGVVSATLTMSGTTSTDGCPFEGMWTLTIN